MSTFDQFWAGLKERRPELAPPSPADISLSQSILRADLFDGKSGEMVENCRAGLLLFNDDLNAAHNIVQSIETPTGSFWHAIIHRMEQDFSNARYWWHRTGTHPAFDEIFDIVIHRVADFGFLDDLRDSHRWEPIALTDWCQRAKDASDVERLKEVQAIEMGTLLQWCASRVR